MSKTLQGEFYFSVSTYSVNEAKTAAFNEAVQTAQMVEKTGLQAKSNHVVVTVDDARDGSIVAYVLDLKKNNGNLRMQLSPIGRDVGYTMHYNNVSLVAHDFDMGDKASLMYREMGLNMEAPGRHVLKFKYETYSVSLPDQSASVS